MGPHFLIHERHSRRKRVPGTSNQIQSSSRLIEATEQRIYACQIKQKCKTSQGDRPVTGNAQALLMQ